MTADDVLRYAASLDQVSPHVLAAAVVRAARARGLALSLPEDVEEVPGHGIRGRVDGHRVAVGKAGWTSAASASAWTRSVRRRAALDGALTIFVDVDGAPVGALLLDDPIRPDAARTIRQLRRDGIRRIVMVTGDREENAQTVGAVIGVDDVFAERTPAEKVEAVRLEKRAGNTIMVGDGINDAPALALADVGVAVGARGATASSEAADVVLTVDRLDRLGEALVIARRSRRIALRERRRRHGPVARRHGRRRLRLPAARVGCAPPRAHRRRRHRERTPGVAGHDLGEPAQRRGSRAWRGASALNTAPCGPTSPASATSPTTSTPAVPPSRSPGCETSNGSWSRNSTHTNKPRTTICTRSSPASSAATTPPRR